MAKAKNKGIKTKLTHEPYDIYIYIFYVSLPVMGISRSVQGGNEARDSRTINQLTARRNNTSKNESRVVPEKCISSV